MLPLLLPPLRRKPMLFIFIIRIDVAIRDSSGAKLKCIISLLSVSICCRASWQHCKTVVGRVDASCDAYDGYVTTLRTSGYMR